MKKEKGVTLLETLIVVSIISILTGVTLANYRKGDEIFSLQRAASNLLQEIKKAKDYAMHGKLFEGTFPSGGYGIYFSPADNRNFILFADKNRNSTYDSGEGIEILDLKEKEVIIENTIPPRPLTIIFLAPDPTVRIIPSASEARIVLSLRNQKIGILVNQIGLIEFFNP